MPNLHVVVVGAGAMGLPTACELARRGHHVTTLDQFGAASAFGSSSGASRMFRLADSNPELVALAVRARDAWRTLELRSGEPLLRTCGQLIMGAGVDEIAGATKAAGVAIDEVGSDEVRQIFPELQPEPDAPLVWQDDGAVISAATYMRAQLVELAQQGAVVEVGPRVISVRKVGEGVRVVATSGSYEADVAVIAAGPWSPALLRELDIDVELTPVLEQVSYVRGGDWPARPCINELSPGTRDVYGLATAGYGYKFGMWGSIREFDPADFARSPDLGIQAELQAYLKHRFPGFPEDLVSSEVCATTRSPDERFILDRIGSVVVAAGDSAGAFKFSPLIGTLLADLVEGTRDPALDLFTLRRFMVTNDEESN